MIQLFATARAWLAAIDPAAPAAALVLIVFLSIYAIRRFLPGVWLWIESRIPFVDSLDYRPVATIVWKFVQALPGALLGAAVASLSSGASVKNALLGVLAGFAASLVHEVMAAYKGQVGARPKPPTGYVPERSEVLDIPDEPSERPTAPLRALSWALCLLLAFPIVLPACGAGLASVVAVIAQVATWITDATNVLAIAQTAVDSYFAKFPNPAAQAKIEDKLQAARLALAAAAKADNAAIDLTAEQADASLADFRAAWADLEQALAEAGLTSKIGANESGAVMVVGVAIPRPIAVTRHIGAGK
jgi:hypothetical protein